MSSAPLQTCRWCGAVHGPLCPMLKAIEFHADGATVKRVEFLTNADFPTILPKKPEPPVEEDYPRLKPATEQGDA